jgi:hypothetical protein
MKIEIEVTDCRDCPCNYKHIGHGEGWYQCTHPKNNQPTYGNILWGLGAKFEAVPNWCPIKEKNHGV